MIRTCLLFCAALLLLVQGDSTGLGQGFYLPGLPLIEDNGSGKSIFDSISEECINAVPSYINREEKTLFENTQSFYSKLGLESSLSGEITDGFTLGASLLAATNAIDSKHLDVKGVSMDVYAVTGFWEFLPDCLTSLELNEEFLSAFENLPESVEDASKKSSWFAYETFLKIYGSHITKRITHGSKLTRYVFSKSSEKISSADFLVKVCATLKDVNLTYCSNFTAEDYSRVAHLATSEELTVRGGTADTRAQLMINVTDDLLRTFLTEAGVADQPISQQYTSIWDILKARYIGSGHFKKAVNLESYYLGYLNTGCLQHNVDGVELRKFVLVEDDPFAPEYECQLAPIGCRGDNDCHIGYAGSTCYCYGDSCVEQSDVSDPRHTLKEGRYVKREQDSSSTWDGANNSCHYHVGVYCVCDKHYGGSWKTMWPTGGYGHKENMYTYRAMHNKLDKFQRPSA